MALRAGYKGFKKLAPGLKLRRPGTIAIDNVALNEIFPNWEDQAVFGAINVLNHSATSQTLNTCVITVDADDRTIDFNGTPTGGNASLQLITADQLNALLAKYGDLFLSGCPSGGAENKYSLFTRYGENNFDRDTGNGVWLRAYRTYDRPLYAQVIQGTVADHLVFKPMLAKSENAPYAPFAMTNKELTDITQKLDKVENITSSFFATLGTGIEVCTSSKVFVSGNRIVGDVVLKRTGGFTSEVGDTLLNTDYMPLNAINSYAVYQDAEYSITSKVNLGYLYISPYNADVKKIIFKNNTGDSSEIYVKFHLDYIFKSGTANRSLPEATREAAPEDVTPEEEPEVKKTTRKKSTAKAETEKEGE